MNINKAIEIINTLANGADPFTGEVLPQYSPYQCPDTKRALFLAIKGLEKLQRLEARKDLLPNNAGKPWSLEETEQLKEEYNSGITIKELSVKHERTLGAIKARLMKSGIEVD